MFPSVLDRGGQIDVIFLDFQKAFDVAPHGKLICKLLFLGFPGFILSWICAYVHRQQCVVIDGKQSDSFSVTSSIPQESVLGCLLVFLIYCIVDVIHVPVNIRLFVDDCIIFNEINTDTDQLLLSSALKI